MDNGAADKVGDQEHVYRRVIPFFYRFSVLKKNR